MPKQSDPQQRPMFGALEMARLDVVPAPSPTGPKPDPKQLTLTSETPNESK